MTLDYKKKVLATSMYIQCAISILPEGEQLTAWRNTARALEFAKKYHTGTRKDKVTPEFQHQLEIVLYLMQFVRSMGDLAPLALSAALLHDVREDYDIDDMVIRKQYGDMVADAVECLTKEFRGEKEPMEEYFHDISFNLIAALVKGGDRIHNIKTMLRVFSMEKQREYVDEVKTYFLPMLKQARKNFPEHRQIFESMKRELETMVEAVEVHLETWGKLKAIHYPM